MKPGSVVRTVTAAVRRSWRWRPTTILEIWLEAVGVAVIVFGTMATFDLLDHERVTAEFFCFPLLSVAIRVGVGRKRLARHNDELWAGQANRCP